MAESRTIPDKMSGIAGRWALPHDQMSTIVDDAIRSVESSRDVGVATVGKETKVLNAGLTPVGPLANENSLRPGIDSASYGFDHCRTRTR